MIELRYRFWKFIHDRAEQFWHWTWNAHLHKLSVQTHRLPSIATGSHVSWNYRFEFKNSASLMSQTKTGTKGAEGK
jgi:hypothetical protein